MTERRKESRTVTMFKSAYVRAGNELHFVTLRNISDSGMCFDVYPGVAIGDQVEFCLDSTGPKSGMVVWVENGRIGVSSDICTTAAIAGTAAHKSRSVRLPLSTKAQIFTYQGGRHVAVHNLSTHGACIDDVGGLERGQLLSIKIGERTFERACVRWADGVHVGIAFAEPVMRCEFRRLVDKLHNRPGVDPSGRYAIMPSNHPMAHSLNHGIWQKAQSNR